MKREHHTPGGVSVQVKGKNIPVTPALRDLVVRKMHRLDKYLNRLQAIEVELCTESTRDASHHNHVEATTHVLGRTIRVTSNNSDMHAAIDEAVDKMYRQLNRQKERIKSHHGSKPAEVLPLPEAPATEPALPRGDGAAPVIRVERLSDKPRFEEEAIEEMEALGQDFYVFLNARSEQMNVVYRRTDGTYGLIQP